MERYREYQHEEMLVTAFHIRVEVLFFVRPKNALQLFWRIATVDQAFLMQVPKNS